MGASATLKQYYRVTKPGIVYGNSITTAGGFFLASLGSINLGLLVATLSGTAGVMASACVFNNYIDRSIDAKMKRTQKRPLVMHTISGQAALLFGAVLGAVGFSLLATFTNWLTFWLGVVAFVSYLVLYGIAKRKTVHGTLVGTIPGALPPVAGYTAVTNSLDGAALLLFAVLVCWQMAHFYAIAMYRRDDYARAGLPVMAVKYGLHTTKIWILLYVTAFAPLTVLLTVCGYTGVTYLVVMLGVSLLWLRRGFGGLKKDNNDQRWARGMFGFSLIVLLVFSFMIAVDAWLP